ncbi:MAG: SDR family oxidoreductase [Promethearchaeota archaeon]
MKKKVIMITGCSSGFGKLTAKTLASRGHRVYATMRDIETRNRSSRSELESIASEQGYDLQVLECDVTSSNSVNDAIKTIIETDKRIDVLVNNAGYGLFGPVEYGDQDKIKTLFETNFFGYVRTINAVLPYMRKARDGLIINVSSVMGKIGLPFEGYYCASKFAVEGLSESLVGECYLFGIKVVVVEPHAYSTNFSKRSLKFLADPEVCGEYGAAFRTFIENIDKAINPKGSPQEVADKIAWVVSKKNPPFHVPVGKNARRDIFFGKILSPLTLQKIAARMYGMSGIFKRI